MSDQYNTAVANTTVSIGAWIVAHIILVIPLVNLIMLIIWAFGSDAVPSKKNWAKAMLIMWIISAILSIVVTAIFGAALLESGIFDGYI